MAVMENSDFWDIMPCNPLKMSQCFGGAFWFPVWLTLNPADVQMEVTCFFRILILSRLYGIISQKVELIIHFIVAYLRNPNLKQYTT
jgi:hypothetical protein